MPSTETALQKGGAQPSLVEKLAGRYGLEGAKFYNSIVSVVWPTRENKDGQKIAPNPDQVAAFLMVCNEYDLNPFLREIYPFMDKNGNLKVIVGVDGWIKSVMRHPEYDGHKFVQHLDGNQKVYAITCVIHRRDRQHPIEMTEYLSECMRDTDPWKQWPVRMLHHKAFIQTSRYAFGMTGIVDDDEADRVSDTITVRPLAEPRRISESATTDEPAKAKPTADAELDGPVDAADIKRIYDSIYKLGLSKVDVKDYLTRAVELGATKATRIEELRKSEVDAFIAKLPAIPKG